jgi:hypothetical protein
MYGIFNLICFGESPPIKAGHRETSLHLTTECGTSNITNREMEETQVDLHENISRA